MMNSSRLGMTLVCMVLPLYLTGCPSGGVGDPCIPEDEYRKEFPGFSETEVNVESRSFQCQTRVCLVNRFRGRVSCPYGQDHESRDVDTPAPVTHTAQCFVPNAPGEADARIQAVVSPQLIERSAEKAVYCSCRCAGEDPEANYCSCPSGYQCAELIEDLGLGSDQLAGSYCVKKGTVVREGQIISKRSCELQATTDTANPWEPTSESQSAGCGSLTGEIQ